MQEQAIQKFFYGFDSPAYIDGSPDDYLVTTTESNYLPYSKHSLEDYSDPSVKYDDLQEYALSGLESFEIYSSEEEREEDKLERLERKRNKY